MDSLPDGSMVFNGTLAGHSIRNENGNHGTSVCGVLAGPQFLFDDAIGNHGIECTVIIIPKTRKIVADTTDGNRVKYGNVLDRMAGMFSEYAWKEKGGKNG